MARRTAARARALPESPSASDPTPLELVERPSPLPEAGPLPLTRAELDSLTPSGQILIRLDGRLVAASIAAACSEAELVSAVRHQRAALVGFLDGDRAQPVILGLLRDRLFVEVAQSAVTDEPSTVRERCLDLSATEVVALRCGEARIELRADGRVEIRGIDIVSVAEGTQRILGGNVGIN